MTTTTCRMRDFTHFLSSVLDVGWRISIKAAPNFYSDQTKGNEPPVHLCFVSSELLYNMRTSPFSGGSPLPKVLVTTNTSVSCSRSTTSYSSIDMTWGCHKENSFSLYSHGVCLAFVSFTHTHARTHSTRRMT